ncbi:hypothetical protein Afil01_34030 [Actinorhabdospora filicis]|uniref:AAA+ ATPase domain-containing protein n=1 Tax=Actinorhabdospora filicis TaxID=1785913 RepID=A0A9W6SPY2_9ACTN|nr:AAA family ATPase [Actinorhabdospora filicis]GLZ78596.1 hypothetical protein Afil01_34030 [Actinorhabdospora filicis]
MKPRAPFVRGMRVSPDAPRDGYPFGLPVVRHLIRTGGLGFDAPVTVLCGDNGSGKSTLVEALAVALGFNAEGGSQFFRFATRATESSLSEHLIVTWHPGMRPKTGFFLRAESFYNVASEIERIAETDGAMLGSYGGVSLHERSHGESFLDLVAHRFGPQGLYVLDEPEAALSVHGCLALLRLVVDLVAQGSQFIIATHSPILLAVPGARILEIEESGDILPVEYDDAGPVAVTRAFLDAPQNFLRHLLAADLGHARTQPRGVPQPREALLQLTGHRLGVLARGERAALALHLDVPAPVDELAEANGAAGEMDRTGARADTAEIDGPSVVPGHGPVPPDGSDVRVSHANECTKSSRRRPGFGRAESVPLSLVDGR